MTEIYHSTFKELTTLVEANIPTLVSGPAGAGKNVTIQQVANQLNLDFYFTNAVTQEYKLTGFIDAGGNYHETQFYQAFTKGGLFFLDEMDASTPETLVVLNAAIANGYFDFPNGRVNAHLDFRVIGAANTFGTGADVNYVGRNQLDSATLDRFALVFFDYDEQVEEAIAEDKDIFDFVTAFREEVAQEELPFIVSMRATRYLKTLKDKLSLIEALKVGLLKSMDIETQEQVAHGIDTIDDNKYYLAWIDYLGLSRPETPNQTPSQSPDDNSNHSSGSSEDDPMVKLIKEAFESYGGL